MHTSGCQGITYNRGLMSRLTNQKTHYPLHCLFSQTMMTSLCCDITLEQLAIEEHIRSKPMMEPSNLAMVATLHALGEFCHVSRTVVLVDIRSC